MGGVGLSLVHFSRACRSNLELTSLTIRGITNKLCHKDDHSLESGRLVSFLCGTCFYITVTFLASRLK